jgi:hypothetical protein
MIDARWHPYRAASRHYPTAPVADDGHHSGERVNKLSARVMVRGDVLAMRMIARQRGDWPRRVMAILECSLDVHNATNVGSFAGEGQDGNA